MLLQVNRREAKSRLEPLLYSLDVGGLSLGSVSTTACGGHFVMEHLAKIPLVSTADPSLRSTHRRWIVCGSPKAAPFRMTVPRWIFIHFRGQKA
jgi:hypothetical protein